MERLREEFEQDWETLREVPTVYKTGRNKYQLRCDLCKRHFFVNEVVRNQIKRALESDPTNNPFICDDCLDVIEDLSYGN